MTASTQMARLINITVTRGEAGLLYARSPELKGLLVAAHTKEELNNKIPAAIRDMYAVCGASVLVTLVETDEGGGELTPWVAIPAQIAREALAAAE